MSDANGSAALGGHLDAASAECVKMLEKVLADAKAGRVQALAVVAVGAGGMGPGFVGSDIPQLNLGIDVLKRQIMDTLLMQAQQAQARRPHILRPGAR